MSTVSHETKQARIQSLLVSARKQLTSIVQQAGALNVECGPSECPDRIEIDAQGVMKINGVPKEAGQLTFDALSLASLSVLCEAAVAKLAQTPEEISKEESEMAAYHRYVRRKNSAAYFLDSEAWLSQQTIGAASPWEGYQTAAWVCDVTLSRHDNNSPSEGIAGKLHLIFKEDSDVVLEAKLVHSTGETFYGAGAVPAARIAELQAADYTVHGPDEEDTEGETLWAFCLHGDYSDEYPTEGMAWAAASNDFGTSQN